MTRRRAIPRMAALLLALAAPLGAQVAQPFRNPRLPPDVRARDLLARMTTDEKFWQLYMTPGSLDDPTHDYSHGVFGLQVGASRDAPDGKPVDAGPVAARAHAERINEIQRYFVQRTRLGVPVIAFEEAVHGLVSEGATVFPQAIALAASWDTALVGRVATAVARETRSRGIRQVLSPVVNIAADVRWGRVEETYGEDPLLTSAMGRAFVTPFERMGVVTTPKHFVANVGEGGRDSYPVDLSPRRLEEVDFPPFRALLTGADAARSVMTAYNSVDADPATQSRWLLTDILRDRWGFGGVVISDAAATGGATVLHMTEPDTPTAAAHAWTAGLDVVFQSTWAQHRPYLEAVRRGLAPREVVDRAVLRVLRLKFALGLFDAPFADPDSAAYWNGHATHLALAREAAQKSIVLLRNEGSVLPLDSRIQRIAVIGGDATEARMGGYSAPAPQRVSILSALRQRLGAERVVFAAGPPRVAVEEAVVPPEALRWNRDGQVQRGVRGEYFDNIGLEGTPRLVRADPAIDFAWTLSPPGPGIPRDWYSVRWTGSITVPPSGVTRLGVRGNDGYRLWLGDRLLIDRWRKESVRTTLVPVSLAPGSQHDLRLEYRETRGGARVRLVWDAGVRDSTAALVAAAEEAAKGSDVAVVVAGVEEGEFRDRARLHLPTATEGLIARVAATGTPVVVVLVGGSAITMSTWIDQVSAVLDAWYPGEQGGPAVVDVLFGDVNPAGRLPITFPLAEGQLPLTYRHKPTGRGDDYGDLTGQPLFPFGFGLSYTQFAYSDLTITPSRISARDSARVRFRVTNTGSRVGDEVVQLYVRDELASVAQPVMALKGFRRIRLAAGASIDVTFTLGRRALEMLNRRMTWVVEPGTFRVLIGASSTDIRLRGALEVSGGK